MRSRRVLALVLGFGLIVAACGGSSSPAPSTGGSPDASAAASAEGPGTGTCTVATADASPAATVSIRDFAYDPPALSVKVGDVVAFTNSDSASHTVTGDACDSGTIGKGATVAISFPAAGTYRFSCRIHPTMPDVTVTVGN